MQNPSIYSHNGLSHALDVYSLWVWEDGRGPFSHSPVDCDVNKVGFGLSSTLEREPELFWYTLAISKPTCKAYTS